MRLFFILSLIMLGCAPSYSKQSFQERVCKTSFLSDSQNQVSFGSSISSIESQDIVLKYVDSAVKGRLLGVHFYVFHYPIYMPQGGIGPGGKVTNFAVSYRDPWKGIIVLSWWTPSEHKTTPIFDTWSVGDVSWEVEHMVACTDDDGRPLKH